LPLLTRRLGVYELVAPLATGGMAELFIAKTTGVSGFEKQVALKVIHPNYSSDPDFVRMLVDEAKLAVQLQHANIVQTYDLGQVDGQYYIAMELIDAVDLYKVLKTSSERGLDFPIDVASHITSEVATGLDYAHRKNDPHGRPLMIVHRDVSPQNVLVSLEGEVKIVDFGIAKAALRGQQTQAGVIKGKYFYMSPEQAWGEKIDARTDVFSTGILLHEMLVGEMLYLEEDIDRLLKLVRAADIQAPSRKRPDVPPELDAIVMKALAKRPEDRYQTGADLSTALTRFLRTQFPDFGRVRVARFLREVVEAEPSRADITLPPAAREDFGDENSLIFDLKSQRRVSAEEAHDHSARRREDETRGIDSPRISAKTDRSARSDYDDGGATEYDHKPVIDLRDRGTDPDPVGARLPPGVRAPKPSAPPDFGVVGDDAEPTEFAGARRGAKRSGPYEEESTSQRPRPQPPSGLAARPGVSPIPPPPRVPSGPAPELPSTRQRRPSLAPGPSPIAQRRGAQPPPPPSSRGMMGLGVSETTPRSALARSGSAMEARPTGGDGHAASEGERGLPPGSGYSPSQAQAPNHPPSSPSAYDAQRRSSHGGAGAPGEVPGTGETPLIDWSAAPTVTPSAAAPYAPRTGDYDALASVRTHSPDLRRRKLLLVAGGLLATSLVVLIIALVWPDGPSRGSIEIVSSPSGATVRIDGTVLSKLTPIRISDVDVRQPHHLAVTLRGYDTWESDAKFDGGEREIRLQAALISAVGTLDITTSPAGAEAIVNGRISGTTPTKVGDLPPNEDVTLELRLRGYKVVYKTLQWSGKRALSVSIPLEKAR